MIMPMTNVVNPILVIIMIICLLVVIGMGAVIAVQKEEIKILKRDVSQFRQRLLKNIPFLKELHEIKQQQANEKNPAP